MMTYVNDNENQNFESVHREKSKHTPSSVPKTYHGKIITCKLFSMEEVIMIIVK